MDRENLRKIAIDEARRALNLQDKSGLRFEQRGITQEWDSGIYKNTFETNFRVWESIALVDVELDAKTGEVLSWRNETKLHRPDKGTLTREEAVQIARANVEIPRTAGFPEVTEPVEDGIPIITVAWKFRTSMAAESRTVEVMIHPGTKEVCGVRRY